MIKLEVIGSDRPAIVDNEDAGLLIGRKLYLNKRGYVVAYFYNRPVHIHKLILPSVSKTMRIDHRDCDKLNNRKSNLRICTPTENNRNRRKILLKNRSANGSLFKGVMKRPKYGPGYTEAWEARIKVNHKSLFLGTYATEVDAARAYDFAAREHFGEFARYNIPPEHMKTAPPEKIKLPKGRKRKSKYIGVMLIPAKWVARIVLQPGGKDKYIGSFQSEIEAAKAYDKAAIQAFGQSAKLNFPVTL